MHRTPFLLLPVAAALLAQGPLDPTERLMRAREILVERGRHLPDYTCIQTVDRRYFKRRKAHYAPTCDEVRSLGPHDLILESTDRLRLDIKFSQGFEIGSWAGSQFSSRSIFDLVAGGPYGTGSLGALIWDIFVNGGATYKYIGEETAGGARLSAYGYQVPVGASHYQVKSGSNWVPTAFSGIFWLDANSLDLKRIVERAVELPPETETCEADTTIDYEKVRVGGGEFLLPRQSSMRLVMQDETETQSTAVYSGCREYRGQATIHFDQVAPADEIKGVETPQVPLPAGLPLSLMLTEPIDTGTAAAGDIVKAKLEKSLRDPQSKAVLAPAGAIVEGRIIHMEHWLGRPSRFKISILLEKLEAGGVRRPLYAKLVHYTARTMSGPVEITLRPVGQSPFAAAFLFVTDKSRYLVHAGYQSEWVTVTPPTEDKK